MTRRAGLLTVLLFSAGLALAQTIDPAEEALFLVAQTSGRPADFIAYLDRYPDGVYAEAARFELLMAGVTPPLARQMDVTFVTPLEAGEEGVKGRSIEELLGGTPHYPPIEGLPDEVWKGQPCAACHQWTVADLCEQGKALNRPEMAGRLDLPHPYGPDFKRALMAFANGGCRTE